MENLFLLGGIILMAFFLVGHLSQRLRVPSLLLYMVLGVALAWVIADTAQPALGQAGDLGIVLLFFLLGLQFPLNRLVSVSRKIWRVGFADIGLNFGITALLAYLFGFDLLSALIVGGVAYASSSSITVRMLEETGRTATPEGEFKLALLIFEDIAAPVMVSVLLGLTLQGTVTLSALGLLFAKVMLMTALTLVIAFYGFRRLDLFVKRYATRDFMPLLTAAIAFLWAGFAVYLGLSKLLGAFLAGVMLAETGASRDLGRTMVHLKNLTLPFFFFTFGSSLTFGATILAPVLLIVLILWGVVAKLIVGLWGGRSYGLSIEGSLRAAFSLVQRGEFSVVIAAMAETALRVFSGVYILVTATFGVMLFRNAPRIADAVSRFLARRKHARSANGG